MSSSLRLLRDFCGLGVVSHFLAKSEVIGALSVALKNFGGSDQTGLDLSQFSPLSIRSFQAEPLTCIGANPLRVWLQRPIIDSSLPAATVVC